MPSGFWALSRVNVAPHAGAWIEIDADNNVWEPGIVAPHAGAWIEMERQRRCCP